MLPAQGITLSPSFKQSFFPMSCDSEAEKPHFSFSSWIYVRFCQDRARQGWRQKNREGGSFRLLPASSQEASPLLMCAMGISLACFLTPAAEVLSLDAEESSLQQSNTCRTSFIKLLSSGCVGPCPRGPSPSKFQ